MDLDTAAQMNQVLNAMGMTNSMSGGLNWPSIIANVIVSSIGFVAFIYGKKNKSLKPLGIGVVLMAYPYFIPSTLGIYAIGIGLCAVLYFWRD